MSTTPFFRELAEVCTFKKYLLFLFIFLKAASRDEIHIKLPENISEQMAKGQRERSRIRDLGFPSSLDHLVSTASSAASASVTTVPTVSTEPSSAFDPEEKHKISHPKQPRTWEDEHSFTTVTYR